MVCPHVFYIQFYNFIIVTNVCHPFEESFQYNETSIKLRSARVGFFDVSHLLEVHFRKVLPPALEEAFLVPKSSGSK